jgi:hypothetical protein
MIRAETSYKAHCTTSWGERKRALAGETWAGAPGGCVSCARVRLSYSHPPSSTPTTSAQALSVHRHVRQDLARGRAPPVARGLPVALDDPGVWEDLALGAVQAALADKFSQVRRVNINV